MRSASKLWSKLRKKKVKVTKETVVVEPTQAVGAKVEPPKEPPTPAAVDPPKPAAEPPKVEPPTPTPTPAPAPETKSEAPKPAPVPTPSPEKKAPETPKLPPPGTDGQTQTFNVVVPDGFEPGMRLTATLPNGMKAKFNVPAGAGPGTTLSFKLPVDPKDQAAAVLIQSRTRGKATRKEIQAKTLEVELEKEKEKAAVMVQKRARGVQARKAVVAAKPPPPSTPLNMAQLCACLAGNREARFVTAMRSYDWATATALATTEQERQDIADSISRVEWMQHYIASGNFNEARELAITLKEREEIDKAEGEAGIAATEGENGVVNISLEAK